MMLTMQRAVWEEGGDANETRLGPMASEVRTPNSAKLVIFVSYTMAPEHPYLSAASAYA